MKERQKFIFLYQVLVGIKKTNYFGVQFFKKIYFPKLVNNGTAQVK